MRRNAQEPLLPPAWEALRFESKPRDERKLARLRRKGPELIHLTVRKCKREWSGGAAEGSWWPWGMGWGNNWKPEWWKNKPRQPYGDGREWRQAVDSSNAALKCTCLRLGPRTTDTKVGGSRQALFPNTEAETRGHSHTCRSGLLRPAHL